LYQRSIINQVEDLYGKQALVILETVFSMHGPL